jgi:hypothetical protein
MTLPADLQDLPKCGYLLNFIYADGFFEQIPNGINLLPGNSRI